MTQKIAIVLCNLGGPATQADVPQFLFNLFYDPAIFRLPNPLRYLLAKFVAARRTATARHIYSLMGGGSPILPQTEAQAAAVQQAVQNLLPEAEIACFPLMRYTYPQSARVALQVANFRPERIVFLPLYPQFSTTTTASSLQDWQQAMKKAGLQAPLSSLCCYPRLPGFIAAHARLLETAYQEIAAHNPLVLFSAHGLPVSVIKAGDPYQWQIEQTAQAIMQQAALPALEWQVTYQSRVGPLEWLQPATDQVIRQAGGQGRALLIVPLAFVSEHSETLVELDIEYRQLAEANGVKAYQRVPALGVQPLFIQALAEQCVSLIAAGKPLGSAENGRICPPEWGQCCMRL